MANGVVVSAIQTSKASRVAGGFLALAGVLDIVLLALDQVLRTVPQHFYALVVFVVIDFILAGFVLAKPSKTSFTLALAWSLIRIIIQAADVSQGPVFGFTYGDFADYLFNPLSSWQMKLGNATGIPAVLIDLIVLFEIIVFVVAWNARSQSQ